MSIRATFECGSLEQMLAWAREFLEENGYEVRVRDTLHARETPGDFAERMGINPGALARCLRVRGCPTDFEIERGPSGRILWLRASRALEEFIALNQRRNGSKPNQEEFTHAETEK